MLLVLGSAAFGCASGGRQGRDYMFGVTGVVTAEDGTPLEGAEVTLEVNGPVYEAVSPVKSERRLTNNTGGFVFTYNSHAHAVKYVVTARKEGFQPQKVSGSAPPAGHHTIRLKKAV
jgi:hypothetical protein